MGNVLVLGCGPAGLMAAAAAEESGNDVTIVSKKRKSEMYGAQYLHAPIPGFSPERGFSVKYVLRGTSDDYRRKVYGDPRVPVSPDELSEDHEGWDIRSTYGSLWHHFQDRILNTPFNGGSDVKHFIAHALDSDKFNHFISTVPAPLLCTNPSHVFPSQKVWAIGDAPERGIFCPITQAGPNEVICSGEPENSWYRTANIMGYRTAEWPENRKPPIEGLSQVSKPLKTNCDCLPMVHRLGRYGKWEKGVLSHDAYYETKAGLSG